jgi:hypothetical protein
MPDFYYYWETVNEVSIGSNGWVSFEAISNISYCFPTLPDADGFNYLLAPFMFDLRADGTGNPSQVWYYDDASNERFIISYIDYARYASGSPGWAGSNTFQIILSRADSSITFQYEDVENNSWNNNGGCASEHVVGIENGTGNIGLTVFQEDAISDDLAIKFYYPSVGLIDISDVGPDYNINGRSEASIQYVDDSVNVSTSIKNTGNVDVTSAIDVTLEIRQNNVLIADTMITIPGGLTQGASELIGCNFPPLGVGLYEFVVTTTNIDDVNVGNDTRSSLLPIVDLSGPFEFGYAINDICSGTEGSSGWGGVGVIHELNATNVSLDSVSVYIHSGGVSNADLTINIYDAMSDQGVLGNLLLSEMVSGLSYGTDQWNTFELSTPVSSGTGNFFITLNYDDLIIIGVRNANAGSKQSWEYIGAWSSYRDNSEDEYCIVGHYADLITAIAPNSGVQSIKAFPNPSESGEFVLSGMSGDSKWFVFNALGAQVSEGQGVQVDISELNSGVYQLVLEEGGSTTLVKP